MDKVLGYVKKLKQSSQKIINFKYVAICLLIMILCVVTIPRFFSESRRAKSVNILSGNLDYEKKEAGAWNVNKSASWISKGEAEIVFDVDSILKLKNDHTDMILVLDNSLLMTNEKMDKLKESTTMLVENLLSSDNNKVALISYNENSEILSGFTNNKETVVEGINSLEAEMVDRSYYRALENVDKLMKLYEKDEKRIPIVLFLAAGSPNKDNPLEAWQYKYLKEQYPYLVINAVQYEMENKISERIKNMSDHQYTAYVDDLSDVLHKVSIVPAEYDDFQIIDYIDTDYFYVESVDSVKVTAGSVDFDSKTQQVNWKIPNYETGTQGQMKIKVKLKDELISRKAGSYSTNTKEVVVSKLGDVSETVESKNTPVLVNDYKVSYDANLPSGCISEVPKQTSYSVFETVEISDALVCEGYEFKNWSIVTEDVRQINEDYFTMPDKDVMLRAEWSKLTVQKRMDGTIIGVQEPIIQSIGENYEGELWQYKSAITNVIFEDDIRTPLNTKESWDISALENNGVIGHIVPNEENTSTYTAYIQGVGGVIANEDSSYLFKDFINLESIDGLEYFDTSMVGTMYTMFGNCQKLTELNLSNFNTQNVTSMSQMFKDCKKLVSLDIRSFDTSKVLNMSYMFDGCSALATLSISNFNTSSVTMMQGMFRNCSALKNLNLNNFNTSNVNHMELMFQYCSELETLKISNFDTSAVTNMSYMFSGCSKLTSLDVSSFDTSMVDGMDGMFRDCSSLPELNVSGFDTSNVIDMSNMFKNCSKLTSLNVSDFDTQKVTNMADMFSGCSSLTGLNVSNFKTPLVTNMSYMFYNCSKVTGLNVSGFDTQKVTNMEYMFHGCSSLTELNVSSFKTLLVTNMARMFRDCNKLTSLDLSNFITPKLTNIERMFMGCSSLKDLNVSNFNTSLVTDMAYLFNGCVALASIDVSSFNTSKVLNMSNMFCECKALTELDLSNFNTSKVTRMDWMFGTCSALTSLNISSFTTPLVENVQGMFRGISKVKSLDLSGFNLVKVVDTSQMFSNCYEMKATLTISNPNVMNYTDMFRYAATTANAQITVNYTSGTEKLVEDIISSATAGSNIVKGTLANNLKQEKASNSIVAKPLLADKKRRIHFNFLKVVFN